MTENMKTSIMAINKFFYYAMNFESNFIAKIWGPRTEGSLSDHLQNKFDYLYGRYGSQAVMMAFYAELDGSHRKKLLEYIVANYNGDVKLKFDEED